MSRLYHSVANFYMKTQPAAIMSGVVSGTATGGYLSAKEPHNMYVNVPIGACFGASLGAGWPLWIIAGSGYAIGRAVSKKS